jgi:hypothetical protein
VSLLAKRADIALDRGSNDVLRSRADHAVPRGTPDPVEVPLPSPRDYGSISSRFALLQMEDLPADSSSSVLLARGAPERARKASGTRMILPFRCCAMGSSSVGPYDQPVHSFAFDVRSNVERSGSRGRRSRDAAALARGRPAARASLRGARVAESSSPSASGLRRGPTGSRSDTSHCAVRPARDHHRRARGASSAGRADPSFSRSSTPLLRPFRAPISPVDKPNPGDFRRSGAYVGRARDERRLMEFEVEEGPKGPQARDVSVVTSV